MPTNASNSEAAHVRTRRKERQVRNSCNACSAQKIRCGKERPECHRCVEKGRECEYSMSRRTGERPRVINSPVPQCRVANGRDKTPSTIASDPPKSFSENRVEPPSETTDDHFSAHEHQDIAWMLSVSPDMAMSLDLNSTTDMVLAMSQNNDVDMVTAASQEFESPVYEYNFDSIIFHSGDPPTPRRSDSQQADSMQTKLGSCSPSESGSLSLPQRKANDCLNDAMQILTYFHVPAQECLTSANNSTYSMQEDHCLDFTPREVGTVLSQHGKALRKLGNLLECRCCLRQEVTVVICLSLHKAIGWYAEILGDESLPQYDDFQPSSPFGRIAKAPSFMGSYRLDHKAQKLLSAHLVLTQLKEHIEPLMKKLSELPSAPPSVSSPKSAPTSSLDPRPSLIEHHRQNLQDEIDGVVARASSIKQK